jgi:hypothetical protein
MKSVLVALITKTWLYRTFNIRGGGDWEHYEEISHVN